MNNKQKIVMLIGILNIVAMCAYPPCNGVNEVYGKPASVGHYPIWNIPELKRVQGAVAAFGGGETMVTQTIVIEGIALSTLGVQVFAVALLTGGLILTVSDRKETS